ncbi:MAG: VOC family protein [Pseudonocardiales bacterium]|nr:VOC family protein [Pseudonocardiales bacterium]
MSVTTTTHLNFRGEAREALELYSSIFGGQVLAFTYGDAHVDADGAVPDQLMWGGFQAPNGLSLMAFDVPPARPFSRGADSVFVSVRGDDAEEITKCFNVLAEGGTVRTALGPAAWGAPLYGMLDDRFGITWVLDVMPSQS